MFPAEILLDHPLAGQWKGYRDWRGPKLEPPKNPESDGICGTYSDTTFLSSAAIGSLPAVARTKLHCADDALRIGTVSLICFGAVTHDFNTGQHFIPLSFSIGNGSLTVPAPANADLAPPGSYMLLPGGHKQHPSFAAIVHF